MIVKLKSINGQLVYVDCLLLLEPICRMTQTLNRILYEERDHLKIV
jgi:hypothetical protein